MARPNYFKDGPVPLMVTLLDSAPGDDGLDDARLLRAVYRYDRAWWRGLARAFVFSLDVALARGVALEQAADDEIERFHRVYFDGVNGREFLVGRREFLRAFRREVESRKAAAAK